MACQSIGNHPNEHQLFGHDELIGEAEFGHNPNTRDACLGLIGRIGKWLQIDSRA
jgi:hypothetical protein